MSDPLIKIGTRGSRLALVQTHLVRELLREADEELREPGAVEVVTIKTGGDKEQGRALAEIGGKGLFVKEIEQALLEKRIDMAVHSMKDMPSFLPEGLDVACILPREDPRDVFFAREGAVLEDLPRGATFGTASARRQALVLARRPDLKIKLLRGNVETRLNKMQEGEVDAMMLAAAGLKRLDMEDRIKTILQPEFMLPAVGQGAIGIEIRADDMPMRELLDRIHCFESGLCLAAERAFLAKLGGSCRSPIAGLAELSGAKDDDGNVLLDFNGLVARMDGSEIMRVGRDKRIKSEEQAAEIGFDAADELLSRMPEDFFPPELF